MIDLKNNRVISWIAALVGLISWPLAIAVLFVIWLFISKGSDSGWVMMAMGFKALGVIVIVHLVGILATATIWMQRKARHEPAGTPIVLGLIYYGLLVAFFLILEGPRALLSDSASMIEILFK